MKTNQKDTIYSGDIKIGNNVIIRKGCYLCDNVTLGRRCRLGRNVSIGNNSTIGPYAIIKHSTNIGSDCKIQNRVVIGIGSIIGSDSVLEPNCVVGGNGYVLSKSIIGAGKRVLIRGGDRLRFIVYYDEYRDIPYVIVMANHDFFVNVKINKIEDFQSGSVNRVKNQLKKLSDMYRHKKPKIDVLIKDMEVWLEDGKESKV